MKEIQIFTPRLILRPPVLDDAEEISLAKQEVWKELQRWMSWAYDGQETLEATRQYIKMTLEELEKGYPHLLARHKSTGELVCSTGATSYPDDERSYSTGYWVAKKYLGQGFATEATIAAIRFAFEKLKARAVHIDYYEGNDKSRRIIDKLGFTFSHTVTEGHKRCLDGQPLDVHHYVMHDPALLPSLDVHWN